MMQYFYKHFAMKTDILGEAIGLRDFAGKHLLRGSIWSCKMISLHLLFQSHTEVIKLCFCHQSAVVKIILMSNTGL